MRAVEVIVQVDAPVARIWEVLADFGGFLNWAGGPDDTIRAEGNGIGMIRHLSMGVGEIAEKLTELDADQMILGYELVYGEPIGMKEYRAQVQVKSVGDKCELYWLGAFQPVDPSSEDQVAETLDATYRGMSKTLAEYVQ